MNNYLLDEEEQDILTAFEADKIKSIPDLKNELNRHRQIAATTLSKNEKVIIHLDPKDLSEIQRQANSVGIPYQIFIANILHQFVDDKNRLSY